MNPAPARRKVSRAAVARRALGAGIALLASAQPAAAGSGGDLDWWSLRPLTRPAPPPATGGNEGVIDRFVAAKHREHGLRFSPPADRRTLIRRLYFNLTGLPPTVAEVDAFAADDSPDAYPRLVDRLLESEAYGERWARHWLDVVHYGDTHGFDKDKPRPNAWPYRDYVIRAFNEDRNYTRFVKEQLAGDVLWPGTADGIVATGFIAAGPWDFIGHAEVPEEKIDGKVARHLDRDDMVATAMNTFCALTVQCAQCHDHKRDPVVMEDYYALQAVFAALDRADRTYDPDPATAVRRAGLAAEQRRLEDRRKTLEAKIEAGKPAAVRTLETRIAEIEGQVAAGGEIAGKPRSDRYGYHSQVAREQATVKWVQVDLGAALPVGRVVVAGADEYGFADFGFPHRFKVEVASRPGFEDAVAIADHTGADFPRPGALPVAFEGGDRVARYVRVTATKLWSRRNRGQPLTGDWIFALGELAVLTGGEIAPAAAVTALDSIEALPRWGKKDLVDGIYGRYPLADRAPAGIAAWLAADPSELRAERAALVAKRDRALAEILGAERAEIAAAAARIAALEAEAKALPPPRRVYAGTVHTGSGAFKGRGHTGGQPREIFVLHRGDVTRPRQPAPPGTVPIIPGVGRDFDLPADHPEGARRAALAEWVVRRDNPLTWRTVVNRVWQYHFGRGIVGTPNDFGRMGKLPTHPELLDWLACEFRDGGQSFKALHRLICNSRAYRQASAHDPDLAAADGGNRFLWRMNRRRLEAEAVRDTVLLVSGKLDRTMYGPGFQDFVIERPEHSPHYQYHKYDPDDPKTHRRSIYRFLVRSQPQPFMDTLDCADPSMMVGKRNETLTALQALALLNNAFVTRMAEHFAARVEATAGTGTGGRELVTAAYRTALGRDPDGSELALLVPYLRAHGLPNLCRAIFNLNEFAFVD